jgi:hypothetical protein
VTGTILGMDDGKQAPKDAAGVAEELRRIREAVRERALLEPRVDVLPAARSIASVKPPARDVPPEAVPAPARPDNTAVNASWQTVKPPAGLRGRIGRLLLRLLAPSFEAQVAWNARQVQLDNELLEYLDARFAATHDHYDRVLGLYGRHLNDVDERHLILQEELVAHVHDLVGRVDLVLGEAERGRLGLESALRDLRTRLLQLEARVLQR